MGLEDVLRPVIVLMLGDAIGRLVGAIEWRLGTTKVVTCPGVKRREVRLRRRGELRGIQI